MELPQLFSLAVIALLALTALVHSIGGERLLLRPMFAKRGNAVLDNWLAAPYPHWALRPRRLGEPLTLPHQEIRTPVRAASHSAGRAFCFRARLARVGHTVFKLGTAFQHLTPAREAQPLPAAMMPS